MKIRLTLGALALVFAVSLSLACCADVAQDARKISQDKQDAVVTVQMVLQMTSSYGGQSHKREGRSTATGTVIDPSGLVVASLTEVDPSSVMSRYAGDEDGDSTRVVDAKIRTADGTDMPAEIVLRDRDLDLVFIRPKTKPEQDMPYVNLTQCGTAQAVDEVVILSRAGQVANRATVTGIDRITAVVTKPRTLYLLSIYASASLGCPVFTLDGKVLGIVVLRMPKSKEAMENARSGMKEIAAVVLPCSTLQPIAEQAKTAKAEKAATPSPEPKPKPTPKPAQKPGKKPSGK